MLMLVLRFTHIVFGALWVGMMVFTVFFLAPAVAEAGPEGGKLMAALQRRKIMIIMPVFALITLVSGMWLFDRLAGGQHAALMQTPMGMAFAWGALAAVIAFLLGIIVMRPIMVKVTKLGEVLATAPPEERAARSAEIQRLRGRSNMLSRVVAVLLLFALAAMAVARYV
ncbi:MAG: hypothetical protein ACREU4_02625 [Burkholderiales bacterium]